MISLQKVRKGYHSSEGVLDVLKGVDLNVQQSDFVSLLGRSGEGKSTLLNILGGFDSFNSGSYEFNGIEVSSLNSSELTTFRMNNIGFVFQSFHLIKHLTVLKNIELPLLLQKVSKTERRVRSLAMLKRLGLEDKQDYYPRQLSGGQCQRVAIARALVVKPSLILADEPTGSLDRENADSILNLFQELNQEGHCIVLVTHDPLVAQRTNRTYKLQQGVLRTGNV
ncbi:ABC transporter ATP-binding protein [Thalassotalea marina]|uniref:Macrolide ABC transporter ATP-binding protein n=1 Tax=Thalassotalea marina TaxID=1673741 RepID=A0A919BD35_9GAMM|nr:ABC transporter ATP-binding protein [Thalassotalea marina]GHF84327.1 macrolide ABC transporter ATP-binding protein [Thalassotalea marina]